LTNIEDGDVGVTLVGDEGNERPNDQRVGGGSFASRRASRAPLRGGSLRSALSGRP
jgi:hypothetical protein